MSRRLPRTLPGCAVVVLFLAGCSGGSGSGLAGKQPASASPDSVHAGWQVVSSLGLEVSAPADWPFNAWSGCGPPPPAVIERDQGGVAGCGNASVVPSALRIRVLEPASEPGQPATSVDLGATSGTVVRGRTADGRYFAKVDVPDLQAEASVESPDEKIVDAIIGSVRAVDVDNVGCTTRLMDAPSWDRAAPGPAIRLSDRGQVGSVVVCHYQRSHMIDGAPVLGSSVKLTGARADAAVATIEHAAAGALPAVPERQCLRQPETDPLWLQIGYPDGADPVSVHVRYSTCEERWTASPSGVSHVTQAQLKALLGPLHTGYGYSSGIPAR